MVKENAEALVVATKEIGLEVNADKTKYMIMSRDQNAGQSHILPAKELYDILLTAGLYSFLFMIGLLLRRWILGNKVQNKIM